MPDRTPGHRPLVLVSVGTDHHRFDRLIRWVDGWLADGGSERARCLVQRGTSVAPARAESTDYLDYAGMQSAMREAAAVVCHGGPSTIMDSRRAGLRPIVVARRAELGEHVDDHQVAFTRRLAVAGEVELAESERGLREQLDRALAEPDAFRAAANGDAGTSVERFAALVDELVGGGGPGFGGGPIRVLFIGGAGRSGSTILDLILGQVPGMCAVGEVVHLWRRGLKENQLCGCGEPFLECGFWRAVGDSAFGGWDAVDADETLLLQRTVDRNRFIPLMVAPFVRRSYRRALRDYAERLGRLYRAIGAVSGSRVVVDSTKHASSAYLLRRVPGVDLRLVHLVRDSRGVAFSLSKRVRRPEVFGGEAFMPRYRPARVGGQWMTYNAFLHGLAGLGVPTVFLRYEQLVGDPAGQVGRVLGLAGIAPEAGGPGFVEGGRVDLGPTHTVSGNPMRFRQGRLDLRRDEEWRRGMRAGDRALVSAMTWPLRALYGYTGHGGAADGARP